MNPSPAKKKGGRKAEEAWEGAEISSCVLALLSRKPQPRRCKQVAPGPGKARPTGDAEKYHHKLSHSHESAPQL
jgi:hypothetical protein